VSPGSNSPGFFLHSLSLFTRVREGVFSEISIQDVPNKDTSSGPTKRRLPRSEAEANHNI
jgi:hypothetical protein